MKPNQPTDRERGNAEQANASASQHSVAALLPAAAIYSNCARRPLVKQCQGCGRLRFPDHTWTPGRVEVSEQYEISHQMCPDCTGQAEMHLTFAQRIALAKLRFKTSAEQGSRDLIALLKEART